MQHTLHKIVLRGADVLQLQLRNIIRIRKTIWVFNSVCILLKMSKIDFKHVCKSFEKAL